MDIILFILMPIIVMINVAGAIGIGIISSEFLWEDDLSSEWLLPIFYKRAWDYFRDYVNKVGTTLLLVLINLIWLPAIIAIFIINYLVLIPLKWIGITLTCIFMFIFKNRDKE